MTAEAKLAGAMKDLATIAAVHEEARGVVITLSGSVLFASGKFALLETAKTKLDQVAMRSRPERRQADGHRGPHRQPGLGSTNMPLSLNRANAVRDYLVSQGVDANQISDRGDGLEPPAGRQQTAENRANNRRVEIVIHRLHRSAPNPATPSTEAPSPVCG